MTDAWLVVNAGSSSIRAALYAAEDLAPLLRVHVETLGGPAVRARWSGTLGPRCSDAAPAPGAGHDAATGWLLQTINARLPELALAGVGHRVVHGGREFAAPVAVDAAVLEALERLAPLAPQHQPHNLAAIRAVAARWPRLRQVACFDTAFHRSQPPLARAFALPRALTDAGIERYGFHGLSYEFLAGELPRHTPRAGGRVILAHLGHGASLCALRAGRSVATTMGFSTLDGLVMGTRCGAIDAGVLLHLMQTQGYDEARLRELLYARSGLLGVSAISDDVRTLEASGDARAAEALELFAYRAAAEIGALASVLEGLDALVFSAGIGEHSARMRAAIGARCAWLGVVLDADANRAGRARISAAASAVDVLVIPTDEELVIARAVRALCGG